MILRETRQKVVKYNMKRSTNPWTIIVMEYLLIWFFHERRRRVSYGRYNVSRLHASEKITIGPGPRFLCETRC